MIAINDAGEAGRSKRLPQITRAQWRTEALGVPGALGRIDRTGPDEGIRESIFLIWKTIATAPTDVKHLYTQIVETEILGRSRSFDMRPSDYGLAFLGTESDREIVEALGGCLRRLESEFTALDLGARPIDPNDDWLIRHGQDSAFLVPMGRLAWRGQRDPAQDLRPFDQRGVLRLRLIPTVIDGAAVRLVRPNHLGKSSAARFGAVLFPKAKFKCDETPTTFVVRSVAIPDAAAIIAGACESAHSSRCLTAVFPELTIDPQSRDLIQDLLWTKPWLRGAVVPEAPGLVVAGSWHEPVGAGIVVNVATVFDGHGELLLRHRKRYAYKDPKGKFEPIQPGDEFAILVLDDALFAFGDLPRFLQPVF